MTMPQKRLRSPLRTAAVGAVMAVALDLPPAFAQTTLEEITVTARRREVTLETAPVAVSALSGVDFVKANVVKLDNFNGYAPGLVVAKNDGAGRMVAIRGIGWETAQNLGSQPGVLTYMDGVYLANPLALGLTLGELERIEVFRGPQGTEFGQGATGGAINLVTKKPHFDGVEGSVEVSYGSYNNRQGRVSVNAPLSDSWAFLASVQKRRREGFARIKGGALDGYELDDADSLTGKLTALWRPSPAFSARAQIFLHDADQHAAAQKNIDDPNPDPRELTQDYPGIFRLENHSAMLTMEWEGPLGVAVKSLTGWQSLSKAQSVDGDRLTETTLAINRLGFSFENWDVLPFWDNDSKAVSQELNLSHRSERLDWTIGAYYLRHENSNDFLEATGAAPFAASPAARPRAQLTAANLPPFQSDLNFNEARKVTRKDYAFYGQATYRLSDRFAVTAGLRRQSEKQEDETLQFFSIASRLRADDSGLTWKAGVDAHFTENNLVYALVSTGWKNGGVNPGAISGNALFLDGAFAPEEVTAYEIGSRNAFLDNRIRLHVTAFYYDHKNLQFIYEDPVPFAGGTGVIPKTEEYGVETEFSWLATEGWQLDGMAAWQDGKLRSGTPALDVIDFREALEPFQVGLFTEAGFNKRLELANNANLRGNKPPKLVDFTARLALTNRRELTGGAMLTSRVEYIRRGEFQARVFNNPLVDAVPAYDLVNLHFAYASGRLPLTLSLSVTNVFDEDGINNIFSNPYGIWSTSREYIPPREIIGSLSYNW